jgi:hypothetical protein
MTPMDAQKRLVIVGATGMVGGYALRYALEHPDVAGVTAVGRKPTGITHPKLKEVLHQDFADCSALASVLWSMSPSATPPSGQPQCSRTVTSERWSRRARSELRPRPGRDVGLGRSALPTGMPIGEIDTV